MRAAPILSALLLAGCTRPPAAHVAVRRLDGPRPPQVVARCRVDGLKPPIKYQWRLAPGVKQVGWTPPADEPTVLVQLPEPMGAPVWAECVASGEGGVTVRAGASLIAPSISVATTAVRAGDVVTVRGAGFGVTRNDDDALWFVPRFGAARAADHACKQASWSDTVVSACAPASLPVGEWQLRVQAAGALALAAATTRVTR
jgi:hypothetical protein